MKRMHYFSRRRRSPKGLSVDKKIAVHQDPDHDGEIVDQFRLVHVLLADFMEEAQDAGTEEGSRFMNGEAGPQNIGKIFQKGFCILADILIVSDIQISVGVGDGVFENLLMTVIHPEDGGEEAAEAVHGFQLEAFHLLFIILDDRIPQIIEIIVQEHIFVIVINIKGDTADFGSLADLGDRDLFDRIAEHELVYDPFTFIPDIAL